MSSTLLEVGGVVAALALLIALGRSLLALCVRDLVFEWQEAWALSFLIGAGGVSLLLFWLGPLYSVVPARWLVSLTALGLGLAALVRNRKRRPGTDEPAVAAGGGPHWIRTALLVGISVQCAALVLMALQTNLGWDGLFNFESKARMAFANQPSGRVPVTRLFDGSRTWSHPGYPLLLPLTEFWLYTWVGRPDQSLIKVLFPLFYMSLTGLLYGALCRLVPRRQALLGCFALGLLPSLAIGPGAAITGYADVPLAAAFFGTVMFARAALRTGVSDYFKIAALLSSTAAWTKREGLLLAAYVAVATAIIRCTQARSEGRSLRVAMRDVWWLFVGPAVAIGPWWLLQWSYGVPDQDFTAVTVTNFLANVSRVPVIAGLFARELLRPGHWGLLWPAFAVTAILPARRLREPSHWFVVGAVVLPLAAYGLGFIFSAWSPITEHIGTALPRLVIPLAPVALAMTIARLSECLIPVPHPRSAPAVPRSA